MKQMKTLLAATAYFLLLLLPVACQKDDAPDEPNNPVDEKITYTYKQARSPKRGISCNTLYTDDFDTIKNSISWFYNWGTSFNNTLESAYAASGMEFCPMAWNKDYNPNAIRNYVNAHPACQYLMAFNEPNLTDQANMNPSLAADKWTDLKSLADELHLKIVAPAMNYGTLPNYSDPIVWLDEFFSLVPLDDVDALAIHCYMNSPSALKSYVERFRKYGKPIWMTEFCAWEGTISADRQREYMSDIINYFETDPIIERYAWFKYDGPATGNPHFSLRPTGNNRGELTDLGKIYNGISSLDNVTAYAPDEIIPAEHYCQTNMSEVVGTNAWTSGVQLKICSDSAGGILEVANFGLPKWLEYKINVPAATGYNISFRYATVIESKCKIKAGNEEIEISLPATGSYTDWKTAEILIALPAGVQTIRFTPSKGMISFNWWRFKR
ncbi:MAG: carbohydrate-binding protein [Prevotellaceae bacterium]|nr:carbohydrate-binding protein [Prevotellaceae bacterium]